MAAPRKPKTPPTPSTPSADGEKRAKPVVEALAPSFGWSGVDEILAVHDSRPGEHATAFTISYAQECRRLDFRPDHSSFDDAARQYTWAFDLPSLDGVRYIVFATAEYHFVGAVEDGAVRVVRKAVSVVRENNKPVRAEVPTRES